MPEASTTTQPDPLDVIVTALCIDGPRTAGQLATDIGLAYSTLTPRLRQLESGGRAERVKDPTNRRTIWQATNSKATEPDRTDTSTTISTEPATDIGPAQQAAPASLDDAADRDPASDPGAEIADTDCTGARVDNDATAEVSASVPVTTASSTPQEAKAARKPKGTIAAGILEVTCAHPDAVFKVSQLSNALDGTSAGAIANAAAKLVVSGELTLVCEKPASYQAA